MLVFEDRRGRVRRLADGAVGCELRSVGFDPAQPYAVSYDAQAAVLTRVQGADQVALQLLKSVGGVPYLTVFGDEAGQVTLSGVAFRCACDAGVADGPSAMRAWYAKHKASARAAPLRLLVGDAALDGYLTRFTWDTQDPAQDDVQGWSATLLTPPEG